MTLINKLVPPLQMKEFGLIGRSLTHSFSKNYFEKKFTEQGLLACSYTNFELERIESFKTLIDSHPHLHGLNVTAPYKESVLRYLDELSAEASEIGAINCIELKNKKLIGHNTDVYGFAQSIKPFLDTNHQKALVLGSGGAAKAVSHALKKIGVDVCFVSSSEKKTPNTFLYSEINRTMMQAFKMVVNCTPLGMFPNTNNCPALPYEFLTQEHLVVDLIYNPEETLFLKQAKEQGAIVLNGLSMLHLQAEKSWEIWNKA